MSGRVLLLILFLYVALAWVMAGMRPDGQFLYYGLLWTAVGLVIALSVVILQQIWRAWRAGRERAAAKPPKPLAAARVVSGEVAALEVLWREALGRLATSPVSSRTGAAAFPPNGLFLVLGPSNSGKTQTIASSGLDPQLLAGQVRGDSAVLPTRLANFWLAQGAIFVELGGRLYESDQERWINLLMVLRGKSALPLWKRLWRDEPPPQLRGILLFHDVQCAMLQPDSASSSGLSLMAQERLQAAADVFGTAAPVYAIFTKADSVKFFGEYFGRLPQSEASQTFGYTLSSSPDVAPPGPMPWAERETRRLTKAFNRVYRHLAERRLLHLLRESDPVRKPDIYEFPREFRRIRSVLVQLLTDAFKPDSLKAGPLLRGFYFTGSRATEVPATDQTLLGLDRTSLGDGRFNREVDYSEATRIFEPGLLRAAGSAAPALRSPGSLQQQWIFTRQLFLETIPTDLPPAAAVPSRPVLQRYRGLVTAGVAGLALLLGLLWLQSWRRNWNLVQRAEEEISKVERLGAGSGGTVGSVEYLRAVDRIRVELEALKEKELAMRWFLYTGDQVRDDLERFYFRRLDALLLNRLNLQLADSLSHLPLTPPESAQFDPVYKQLTTHLAITSGACGHGEPAIVAAVLKGEARELKLPEGSESRHLVDAQLDFYAHTLPGGNPLRLQENHEARDRARTYLSNVRSVDRIYQAVLSRASEQVPGNVRLPNVLSDRPRPLKGPTEVQAVFSPQGWSIFSKQADDAPNVESGDACVLGNPSGLVAGKRYDAELSRKVRVRYLQEYKERWKQFIAAQTFEPYASLDDAVKKLGELSGNKSPILGLIAFASTNTNIPVPQAQASGIGQLAERLPGGFKKNLKPVEKIVTSANPEDSPAQIGAAFQPVQWIVPPGTVNWVGGEKNLAYLTALGDLRQRLVDKARSSGTPDAALELQATAAADNAVRAVHQLALGFTSVGSEGMDSAVERLLTAPIDRARAFIQDNPDRAQASGMNNELRKFCQAAGGTLRKYPFSPTVRGSEASLDEVALLFAPTTGSLWKLQQSAFSDLVARQGSAWVPKSEGQKQKPSQDLLLFLNKAQLLSDALYPGKTAQPSLQYSLRPIAGSLKGTTVRLEFDGKLADFTETSMLQKAFSWPAPSSVPAGAKAWTSSGGSPMYFGFAEGIWGVFRVFGDADKRDLGSAQIQWSGYVAAGGGRVQFPKPVQLEFVRSQGAADLFNPKFFEGLHCPSRAAQ